MSKKIVLWLTALLVVAQCSMAVALSTEEEIRLGAEAAGRFEAQHGLVTDQAMNERLNRIGSRLIQNAERRNLPWTFRIVNVDQFNAAAFPGGFIYATRGLMNGLTDEELAFVMAHEIGHVDKSHSIKQIESAQLRRLGLIAIAAGATRGNISRTVGTLVQLTDSVIGSQRSQGDEAESDRYGMNLMARAGYDPAYAISAFQKLAKASGGGTPGFLNTLLGSHPLPQDRINDGAELLVSVPFEPVAASPVKTTTDITLYDDASDALEETLAFAGHRVDPSLHNVAANIATGSRLSAPYRTLRVQSPASEGLIGLETLLLQKSELDQMQRVGAVVVDKGDGRVEAVVVLGKGN